MKVKHIIEHFQKEYDPEDNLMLGEGLYYLWEIKGEKVCGTDKVKNHSCGYWCCRKPGHAGDCYCSFKDMNYNDSESYDEEDDDE